MFPRIYEDASCPLDGYEGYTFRLLCNPTAAEKTDWIMGHLGTDGCADCARSREQGTGDRQQGRKRDSEAVPSGLSPVAYCAACQEARLRLGRGAVAVYGTSHVEGFDFSTPDASLATFELPDLPDELLLWLYMLPQALWAARQEDVKKKLPRSLATGDSTPN
jgi:hypothetical protein